MSSISLTDVDSRSSIDEETVNNTVDRFIVPEGLKSKIEPTIQVTTEDVDTIGEIIDELKQMDEILSNTDTAHAGERLLDRNNLDFLCHAAVRCPHVPTFHAVSENFGKIMPPTEQKFLSPEDSEARLLEALEEEAMLEFSTNDEQDESEGSVSMDERSYVSETAAVVDGVVDEKEGDGGIRDEGKNELAEEPNVEDGDILVGETPKIIQPERSSPPDEMDQPPSLDCVEDLLGLAGRTDITTDKKPLDGPGLFEDGGGDGLAGQMKESVLAPTGTGDENGAAAILLPKGSPPVSNGDAIYVCEGNVVESSSEVLNQTISELEAKRGVWSAALLSVLDDFIMASPRSIHTTSCKVEWAANDEGFYMPLLRNSRTPEICKYLYVQSLFSKGGGGGGGATTTTTTGGGDTTTTTPGGGDTIGEDAGSSTPGVGNRATNNDEFQSAGPLTFKLTNAKKDLYNQRRHSEISWPTTWGDTSRVEQLLWLMSPGGGVSQDAGTRQRAHTRGLMPLDHDRLRKPCGRKLRTGQINDELLNRERSYRGTWQKNLLAHAMRYHNYIDTWDQSPLPIDQVQLRQGEKVVRLNREDYHQMTEEKFKEQLLAVRARMREQTIKRRMAQQSASPIMSGQQQRRFDEWEPPVTGDGEITRGDGAITRGDGEITRGDGAITRGPGKLTTGDGERREDAESPPVDQATILREEEPVKVTTTPTSGGGGGGPAAILEAKISLVDPGPDKNNELGVPLKSNKVSPKQHPPAVSQLKLANVRADSITEVTKSNATTTNPAGGPPAFLQVQLKKTGRLDKLSRKGMGADPTVTNVDGSGILKPSAAREVFARKEKAASLGKNSSLNDSTE